MLAQVGDAISTANPVVWSPAPGVLYPVSLRPHCSPFPNMCLLFPPPGPLPQLPPPPAHVPERPPLTILLIPEGPVEHRLPSASPAHQVEPFFWVPRAILFEHLTSFLHSGL